MRNGQEILREEIFFYGEEGEKGMKRTPSNFNDFLRERNFVCRKWLYIRRISKDRKKQKENRDFARKNLLFLRKEEAFVKDE